tara:strand:- start:600 stop:1313 length:714 start_codon:yes stop_codon:yes gene_type:complete
MNDGRVAIVTGGNRGLGLEVCRQLASQNYRVVLTSRDEAKGAAAVQALASDGLEVLYHGLDVRDDSNIARAVGFVLSALGSIDVVVNNAGIHLDEPVDGRRNALVTSDETLLHSVDVNTFGAYRMCRRVLPIMENGGYGRIVNVSSGAGQLWDMDDEYPAYQISKTAMNAVTRVFAAASHDCVKVNSVCPGWVKTDMGGPNARLEISEGVQTIVWLATAGADAPNGAFYRDNKTIDW